MNCICEFLYDIFPNTSSKIQAWSAVGVLGLTGLMAYYAKQALNTWKAQKSFDIYVEAFSKHPILKNDVKEEFSTLYHYMILKDYDKKSDDEKITDFIKFKDSLDKVLIKHEFYNLLSKLQININPDDKHKNLLNKYENILNHYKNISIRLGKIITILMFGFYEKKQDSLDKLERQINISYKELSFND